MKRKRFTDEQIIGILQEHEAGVSATELSRKHGFAEDMLYKWKSTHGGMDVSEAKRLRELKADTLLSYSQSIRGFQFYSHSIVAGGLLETS